jgi:hypothetical protein
MMLNLTDTAPAYEPITDLQHAWAHVGHCLWRISVLEVALDQLIAKLFGTDYVIGQLLGATIDFRKKVQIAHCALPLQISVPPLSDKEVTSFSKPLHAAYDVRNILAHKTYSVIDGKVSFIKNTLGKELKLDYAVWDNVKFNKYAKDFYDLTQNLVSLTSRVSAVSSIDNMISSLQNLRNEE